MTLARFFGAIGAEFPSISPENEQGTINHKIQTEEKYMFSVSLFAQRFNWKRNRNRAVGYIFDAIAFALSGVLAFELRFDFVAPSNYIHPMKLAVLIWIVAQSVAFAGARLDRGNWRYTSAHDAVRIVVADTAGWIMGTLFIFYLLGPRGIPRSVYVLDWMLSCMLVLGGRLVVRVFVTTRRLPRGTEGEWTRTLIYGAGSAGLALLWELQQNDSLLCDVVGMIDDDSSKAYLRLQGKRVLGTGADLAHLARKYDIKRVLIAIPSATGPEMMKILQYALDAGVEHKMVPGLGSLIEDAGLGKQLRDVAVEDLLGRKPVHLDQDIIHQRIQGKVVMVTGAGGSIGSELCRQIARFNPLALVGFDEAETPLFHIERELCRDFPDLVFHAEIGSITHPDTLRRVMHRYQPSILYHAAAYKHVPMMEKHVFAAIENNIFGTWQVALAAINHGIDDFVLISTDKAVRPTSMMGATKRVAELIIRALQKEGGTKFVAVRFGNVLGSNGSVIPIFKEQIAEGGPVTVTHPDMCRYFMTIPEAAQLVLQAFSIGRGGEVFVLDMGKPVRIVDLATNLILLSGLQPNRDIKIQFTGLRPGEKLFEELNLQDECLAPTSHTQIKSFESAFHINAKQMRGYLHDLQRINDTQDVGRLLLLLKDLIPEYNPDSQLLQAALSTHLSHSELAKIQSPGRQPESVLTANLVQASQIN
jgi:FlaA1/EpsC-like NDP-sugar epimerase